MNDKEYTYDIDKYTIGVDENGEDGIGLTVAKVENGEIYFLGNCYGENAKCIDLLIKENQELKKQVEEKEDYINKLQATKDKLDKWDYENTIQQKEFIKYLEDKIYSIEPKGTSINYNCEYDSEEDYVMAMQEQSKLNTLKEILQKYKSIIGE